MARINVKDTEITVIQANSADCFCLTDMLKAKDGDFIIADWLRNRNTLEYIGIWEQVYNPDFNYGEFALIKSQSELNSFINGRLPQAERLEKLNRIAIQQMKVLENIEDRKLLKQDVCIMTEYKLTECKTGETKI